MVIPTSAPSGVASLSNSTVSAPISFAAVAAAGAIKAKESSNNSGNAQIKMSTSTGTAAPVTSGASSPPQVNGVSQSAMDSYSSIYQKFVYFNWLFLVLGCDHSKVLVHFCLYLDTFDF